MAKKKTVKDPLEKKKNKLDLFTTLSALDFKNKDYYNKLTDEYKKQYSAFILMRFMSSAPDQGGLHEYHLLATNDIVNQDFWQLSKYPDFQHLLMCLIGCSRKMYHQWIPGPKKGTKDKVKEFFGKIYPGINEIELKILYRSFEVDKFKELCKDYALDDSEVKELVDNFKILKQNNAYYGN